MDPRKMDGTIAGPRSVYPDEHRDGAKVAVAIIIVCAWCIGLTMLLAAAGP